VTAATASRIRALDLLACGLVFGAGAAIFSWTLGFELLSWEDQRYILENPWIRELSRANLTRIFTQPILANFVPLTFLGYALDYALWGENPFGYHLHSVLLHAVNGVLVWLVARELSGSRSVALVAGLFFAVHPSHVESVAWVSGRKDLLALTFTLGSLYAHLRARAGGSHARLLFAASLLSYALALLSKVVVILLPVFLLLLDAVERPGRWPERVRPLWGLVRGKLVFLPVGALALLASWGPQVTARAAYAADPLQYALVKGHAAWLYLGLLSGLRVGQPSYDVPDLGLAGSRLAALAGLLALGGAAVAIWRGRTRIVVLSTGWILLMIAPALAFPLVAHAADRFLYLPSFGFCLLLATSIARTGERQPALRPAVVAVSVGLCALFSIQTLRYLPVWRDSDSFWSHVESTTRGSLGRLGLAKVRIAQGRLDEAEALLRRTPGGPTLPLLTTLADLRWRQGRPEAALEALARAIDHVRGARPGYGETAQERRTIAHLQVRRGELYEEMGDLERALDEFRGARRLAPDHAGARRREQRAQRRLDAQRGSGGPEPGRSSGRPRGGDPLSFADARLRPERGTFDEQGSVPEEGRSQDRRASGEAEGGSSQGEGSIGRRPT